MENAVADPREPAADVEDQPWIRGSVSRRGFLLGAGVVGAGAMALGTAAGRWMVPTAAAQPAASAAAPTATPTASAAPTATTAILDRTFISTKLTSPHATSWTASSTAGGLLFAAPQGHGSSGLIMDNEGRPVWIEPTGVGITDLRVQDFEGRPVLTYWQGTGTGGHGEGMGTILDTSYGTVAQVKAGNGLTADLHEFRLTDAGTALLIAYPTIRRDLSGVGGPADGYMFDCHVQEVRVRSGEVLLDWSAVGAVGLDESFLAPGDTAAADGSSAEKAFDPFHVNSVDEDGGTLLVSARHTHTLYLLDRSTGALLWRLGGKRSDFAVAANAAFAWQHDARRRSATEISLFDSHYSQGSTGTSRGLFLSIDEAARTAGLKAEYANAGHRGNAEGNVQLLPNGNILVGWGADPAATEFTPDGTAIYETVGLGNASYRVYRFPWTATPGTVPSVGVLPGNGSSMAVFASWNGATEVASWRILTGGGDGGSDGDGGLTAKGVVPRRGFETQFAVANAARVAVEALAADGTVLARSAAVAV
ncbi:arylsulfotransferase family protein [Pseudarthrobacter sp. P1]|uniref:arylsulfotransferase family protein n=1 Tax=Pseudarthrobacter sp. P1 TaxID=3418418 RepID=UPI003CFB2B92